ncbi:MAG TPA: DegT/DnrJ/EryC1/StrS family aminotransferase [Deltaproteobacteria bacterium]|nr:DegT/DnrJ/EryC1/StrS family aminotransferase [Deltaproteobacteria bacterium]HOM28690.1 DegT/DnrJ/EryC1/StrS family aminotransferase [Deltaproteobacteria bacterium]HPP79632.1 DegT/DnrJ/EryC1/StrS family aminotransferase [Deltaproteobacteria bacterium]
MQFIDLAAQQERIRGKIVEKIEAVLAHGQYILGPEVREIEERLAAFVGVKHALSCASGTDALLMALMAYGVGPKDAVFTTPFTFVATAEVISLLGATPVFVDIEPDTFTIDADGLEKAIDALDAQDPSRHSLPKGFEGLRARGIIAVDLFGQCADYRRIREIAQRRGLFLVEDAAQSFGATYSGKRSCSLADIAATSFFPAKPLGCYGDGGMVFTDDDGLAHALESIRVHGKGSDKYDNVRIGINGRCDTLQAAILLAKFEIFPEEIELRQAAASRYGELLGDVDGITCPVVRPGCTSVWAQYSPLCANRAKVLDALREAGIPTAIYYPKPLHVQAAYAYLGYRPDDFPVSMSVASRIFSLPMHPYLSRRDQERIADVIRNAAR